MSEIRDIPAYKEAFRLMVGGYSVIPLGKDKRPLLRSWTEFQTRAATEDEIAEWFTQWPDANIGIVCGKISGISVVDVDSHSGGNPNDFPPTKMVKTANDGYHFYYEYSPEAKTSVDQEKHVDIRSDGSYVVAPPSVITRKDGKPGSYDVIMDIPLAKFPDGMFHKKQPGPAKDWRQIVSHGTQEGGRNNTMAALFGRYMRFIPPSEWEALVWPIGVEVNRRNNPPLSDPELRSIFNSIAKRAAAHDEHASELPEEDVPVVPLFQAVQELNKTPRAMYSTGFSSFDGVLQGGLSAGDLVIVTGPTGNGKTLFSQTMTAHLTKNRVPCVWFSYEVMLTELWAKFKAMGVPDDMLGYTPMRMHSGNTDWVAAKIIEAKEKFGIKVAFIDHLGFLAKKMRSGENQQNFSAYLGSICRELKTVALDTGVAIVLMAHTRKTNGNEITTEDIGFSAGPGQESDIVFVVRRERNTDKTSEEVYKGTTQVKIEKNRRTGASVRLTCAMQNGMLVPEADTYTPEQREMVDQSKRLIDENFR